jgi:valyl-tRNA synthetase
MRGERVYYPMGFDDNGLPTERFAEQQLGRRATEMGREAFINACLELTQATEDRFEALWRRLGLSVDWRFRYSTISSRARRTAQFAFIRLYEQGRVYASEAPVLWCPECQTAIAQAEVEDATVPSTFTTLAFTVANGERLPIATTRPELLGACVAIFVHPEDARYAHLVGSTARTPLFGQEVPILCDPAADREKGTGAVMCCTFGDAADVRWWRIHGLPLHALITRDGRLSAEGGAYAGLRAAEARSAILADLASGGFVLEQTHGEHGIGTHERCRTPIEYFHARQWFIRVLDMRDALLDAGRRIEWHPPYMRARYESWVENLQWDWCISRQRYFGVAIPAWRCAVCDATLLAAPDQLPINPRTTKPSAACACGSTDYAPEPDVMDTWATSSCSPLILTGWADGQSEQSGSPQLPLSLRSQAHDIIRTWAFYSIVQALAHSGDIPWTHIVIAGHGLSAGRQKLSKSRQTADGAAAGPVELIERESADALRYWATSGATGADSPFTPETVATGSRLVTKLWNAGRFVESRLAGFQPTNAAPALAPTDRWLLSRLARTIARSSAELDAFEHAAARGEIERFFWSDLCDNYLELTKARLYDDNTAGAAGAKWTLYHAYLTVLKLFAPYLPFVTEEIFHALYAMDEDAGSIHLAPWPLADAAWSDDEAERTGALILEVLAQVRRYKAQSGLSVGAPLASMRVDAPAWALDLLLASVQDLRSATRAIRIEVVAAPSTVPQENAIHVSGLELPGVAPLE